jgi:hypothetical protein
MSSLASQIIIYKDETVKVELTGIAKGLSIAAPDLKLWAFLKEFVGRDCPVIPVILPGTREIPVLPIFLRVFTWVDFRSDARSAMKRLLWE